VFLKDPLNSLSDEKSNILIVVDGLYESVSGEKKNLLDVIDEEFQLLPKWIKIFITSRAGYEGEIGALESCGNPT
jgi:hypothetical protein